MKRKLALLFVLAGLALPLFAAAPMSPERVTPEQVSPEQVTPGQVTPGQVNTVQLEAAVAQLRRKSDAHVAKQLSELELTERLSALRFAQLNAAMPGAAARLALIALADRSAFLSLPTSDIPAIPVPDSAAQAALLAKTAAFARESLSRLPDFFATELITQYSADPLKASSAAGADPNGQKLRLVAQSSATVRFLAGKEEIDAGQVETRSLRPIEKQLTVQGVFGPILRVVLKDALANHPVWSHWEQGTTGPMAVFQYDVPEEKSHYAVADSVNSGILQPITAYRGEIGVDPASGAILRLVLIAVPHENSPVARANLLVEYGPVEIGGKTYICPLRSVAISLARNINLLQDVYKFTQTEQMPYKLELNDVEYAQYHLFRAEVRVLPGEADGNSRSLGSPPDPKAAPATSPQR